MHLRLVLLLCCLPAFAACSATGNADTDPTDDVSPTLPDRDPQASFTVVEIDEDDNETSTDYSFTGGEDGANTIYCRYQNSDGTMQVRFAEDTKMFGENGTRMDISACNFDLKNGGVFGQRDPTQNCGASNEFALFWRFDGSIWANSPTASMCSFQMIANGDEEFDGSFACDDVPVAFGAATNNLRIEKGSFHCELETVN